MLEPLGDVSRIVVPEDSVVPDANVNVSVAPSTATCDSLTGRISGAAAAVGLHAEATTRAIRLIEDRLRRPLAGHAEPGMLEKGRWTHPSFTN
jgi:hypothetical protein